jgi:hypothetical protein
MCTLKPLKRSVREMAGAQSRLVRLRVEWGCVADHVEARFKSMRRRFLSILCFMTSLSIVAVVLCSISHCSSSAPLMETRVDSTLASQAGGVSGHVLDQATLAALGGATVKLIRAGAVQAEITTSASGYYAFANLVAGTYTLSVNASGYQNASHDLTLSDSGVALDFYLSPIPQGIYQLSGFVYVHGTADPIEGAKVQVGDHSVVTDVNGRYSVRLAPGSYVILVNASGHQIDSHELTFYNSDVVLDFYLVPIPRSTHQLSSAEIAAIAAAMVAVGGSIGWAMNRAFGGRRAVAPDVAKTAPQDLHKITESPTEYHKITESPTDYHKITESPTEYHKITESPTDYHKITESPTEYHKITESPTDYHKITESPTELHKITESPTDYHKITESPTELHKITESPQELHKITESPQTTGQTSQSAVKDQLSESIAKKRRRL